MPEFVKTSFPLFFSTSDERDLSVELKKAIPSICFIDGSRWPTLTPPTQDLLSNCHSKIVFLWDKAARPDLPFHMLDGGRAKGPSSGVVIQFVRSNHKDGILTSGNMGIGYDKTDLSMAKFVKLVWKITKAMNAATLECFNFETGEVLEKGISEYIVGAGAVRLEKEGTVLRHCSAALYYRSEKNSKLA